MVIAKRATGFYETQKVQNFIKILENKAQKKNPFKIILNCKVSTLYLLPGAIAKNCYLINLAWKP